MTRTFSISRRTCFDVNGSLWWRRPTARRRCGASRPIAPTSWCSIWACRSSIVRLTPTEFRILYLLATNAGHVVPASRIYTYVWGSDGGDANALRSHISHLRHKLELLGPAQGTITSVPAVGYVLRRATAEGPSFGGERGLRARPSLPPALRAGRRPLAAR